MSVPLERLNRDMRIVNNGYRVRLSRRTNNSGPLALARDLRPLGETSDGNRYEDVHARSNTMASLQVAPPPFQIKRITAAFVQRMARSRLPYCTSDRSHREQREIAVTRGASAREGSIGDAGGSHPSVNRCTGRLRDIRMMIDGTCHQLVCWCQTRQRILPHRNNWSALFSFLPARRVGALKPNPFAGGS
jgi:hypothetical protein